jgi:transposase
MTNIASYYSVNPKKLQRHYKHKISGFKEWNQLSHAEEYLIYPENLAEQISIDEVSLSKGELYTFVTNKNTGVRNKKSVIAIINGTDSKTIQEVLDKIPKKSREIVNEVTLDMAPNMAMAARNCFVHSKQTIDRFHVVRLVLDALQHLRISYRWEAIELENQAIKTAKAEGKRYKPEILGNGDTLKELLARSRYLLYKYKDEWTKNQQMRAEILFERYPMLYQAYKLVESFRRIFNMLCKKKAKQKFLQWKQDIMDLKLDSFNSVVNSLEYHLENILNFFNNRNTNANAESFNSKIKQFRANLRGVTDVKFFLFRLEKLFT